MALEIRNLSKDFGNVHVLEHIDVQIPQGRFTSLLGPSGCGKTTLLRIIAGLERPTRGSVTLNGDCLVDADKNTFVLPEKRNIAMVFQSYALWPHMSVFENVAFPLQVRKTPKEQVRAEVDAALKRVRLDGYAERMPSMLSGGQQQRVALARALVQKPRLLLLDEPLSNLDADLRGAMRRELRALQQELGLTAIIVTHDWEDASALSDLVVVLNKGHVEQVATVPDLTQKPASDFVRRVTRQLEG